MIIEKITCKPPIYFALTLGIGWGLDYVSGGALRVKLPLQRELAWLVLGVSLMFAVWAVITLFRHKTAVLPEKHPITLVTCGPFRCSRNPMYLSLLLVQFACIWWTGSVLMLVSPVLFVWGMCAGQIKVEETKLRTTFGEAYEHYRHTVRRWI